MAKGVAAWVNARDTDVATPSLVIWEAGEGSVTGYLIKADWDFHQMHRSSEEGLPGGPIIDVAPLGQESHMGLSVSRLSLLIHFY